MKSVTGVNRGGGASWRNVRQIVNPFTPLVESHCPQVTEPGSDLMNCLKNIFFGHEKGIQLAAYRPFWVGIGSCLWPKIRQCC
ncbi:hypothetical protein cgR_5047 [Corynebacterium glutamicum R]|uniref:Uncharacterized protein n=1 Tax=Corynebacterium glutamicum (strain R) TaxID=340322 RepID=A0AB72VD08_CORGB|nr:hypothetical protein cgR_5047 [Corynebacterium glutamicum R]